MKVMTAVQEAIVVKKTEHEEEVDNENHDESATTKELFRRDLSVETPKTSTKTPKSTYRALTKKESATKKKSNSGIPRLKSGTNTMVKTPKSGTYRHPPTPNIGPTINKNTLEVQFINNKKRLLQLQADLVEKQRPLLDMHKSLLRTKAQLEKLGKHVVLEDIKMISLKTDEVKNNLDGAGENPAAETATNLKNEIETALENCVKVCKTCFVKSDQVVKILESASKSTIEPAELEAEVEELKKEKTELEVSVENVVKENGKKIEELINNWQKSMKNKVMSDEVTAKIANLEETVRQQQKSIQEAEDNYHLLSRKFEEKKVNYERTISEMEDKYNKLDEELKKEKKNANDNLMKSRNLRSKVADLELRTKEAEEKYNETANRIKQLQEQMRKKEIQWMKEKEEFKKNELLLQQKFSEKQAQFDARMKEMEMLTKQVELQKENAHRAFNTQLEIKEQECEMIEQEKADLAKKTQELENELEEVKRAMEIKDREIEKLSIEAESIPAIEYKPSESHWLELMEHKQKVAEVEKTIQQQNDQIAKMQSSLKAHAQLAAALKLEKDNAIKYSNKLREILQEARDELEYKNKTIYKIHEKLVLKDKAFEKLKAQMKDYESNSDYSEKWNRNRCQICMTSLEKQTDNYSSCGESEVGKSSNNSRQFVSESLIGMSVRKVDHLRARLDNLKKMNLPTSTSGNVKYSWSQQTCDSKPISNHLRRQIELRGKLYKILQKHADQSCEDFINLLKLTVSSAGKDSLFAHELKPSNIKDAVDEAVQKFVPNYSNVKITESFSTISQYLGAIPVKEIYETVDSSDTDDVFN